MSHFDILVPLNCERTAWVLFVLNEEYCVSGENIDIHNSNTDSIVR